MYFNSFDKRCKPIFGAISLAQTAEYYVDAYDFESVFMQIRYGEFGEYVNHPMQKCEDGRFKISVKYYKCGVYFYRFRLVKDGCEQILHRGENGASTLTPPYDWQQTVYAADYDTPHRAAGGLIYQIFPDRFYKADMQPEKEFGDRVSAQWGDEPAFALGTVGRVINNDYFGGNLKGIREKLPYLQSLGVTIIYLNPIFEAHSNHRYNTADYMKVDPLLGTNEDFRELCAAAKEYGIGIILDGVFSHTGSDSVYFNREGRYDSVGAYQSRESKYYEWFKFQNWPDEYTSWWGFTTLPETVEENESFAEFITGEGGVIDYWMSMGASGFRLDVADELPDEFIEKIRRAVKRANPDGVLYGEVWEDASNKISYGCQRRFLWGNELDSVMNYPFADMIFDFVKNCGGARFINRVMQLLENYPKCSVDSLMNLLSTHDTERLITTLAGEPAYGRDRSWQSVQRLSEQQLSEGKRLLYLATALQYTLPGIPSLYYGDEIMCQGYRDPFNRASFDWSKIQNNEVVGWYRLLGRIRKACPALKDGSFLPAQYDTGYVSYLRVCDDGELYVIVNPSNTAAEIWLLPGWKDDKLIVGSGDTSSGILTVEGKSAAILGRGKWTEEF